ncbi:MAG: T9SS type A sorting domain-containing protein, partial [Ignavibacteriales bacterium]|nr:T9SS type A sorting domain-containing protein [Ignavibacteriales bacterium]
IKTRFFGSAGQPLSDVIEVTTAASLQPDVKIGPNGAVCYAWLDGRENINTGRIYSKVYAAFPTTGVSEQNVPTAFRLEQNFPNPFNPTTTIGYHISTESHVRLRVTDILGREVATLVNEQKAPGLYDVQWNALQAPSGIYLCRLEADGNIATRKMLLLK